MPITNTLKLHILGPKMRNGESEDVESPISTSTTIVAGPLTLVQKSQQDKQKTTMKKLDPLKEYYVCTECMLSIIFY
jgi:hypothetical protein